MVLLDDVRSNSRREPLLTHRCLVRGFGAGDTSPQIPVIPVVPVNMHGSSMHPSIFPLAEHQPIANPQNPPASTHKPKYTLGFINTNSISRRRKKTPPLVSQRTFGGRMGKKGWTMPDLNRRPFTSVSDSGRRANDAKRKSYP